MILGPPGAGKATQARLLASALGLPAFTVDCLVQAHVMRGTPLGQRAATCLQERKPIPDDTLHAIVRDGLCTGGARHGWILVGYPRTAEQLSNLYDWCANCGQTLDLAVLLASPSGRRYGDYSRHARHPRLSARRPNCVPPTRLSPTARFHSCVRCKLRVSSESSMEKGALKKSAGAVSLWHSLQSRPRRLVRNGRRSRMSTRSFVRHSRRAEADAPGQCHKRID